MIIKITNIINNKLDTEDIIDLMEMNQVEEIVIVSILDGAISSYKLVPSSNCYGRPGCEPDEKCSCKVLMKSK